MNDRDGRILLGAAVAVILALAVGVGALLARDGGDGRGADATSDGPAGDSGDGAGEGAAPGSAEVDRVVGEVREFVAGVRELEWQRDVRVELADDEEFRRRLLEDAEADREELEEDAAVLRALRLVAPDVDLYETLLRFLGDSVIGFYDPETDELVLRGTSLSPYVRSTLAHELTHALDDQHFELHRPHLDDAVDESGLAFSAVVEGNAVRVETAYRDAMTDEERADLRREEAELAATIDVAGIPPIIPFLIGFPYLYGPDFVAAVHAEGGERAVDGALREPPTTSEHILRPATWLDGEEVPRVVEPAPDGEVIDNGTYGQYSLELTLAGAVGRQEAQSAAEGWGGDAYVAWTDGDDDRTCVRARFAMDSDRDADELQVALREWTRNHGDAELEQDGDLVGFTACG